LFLVCYNKVLKNKEIEAYNSPFFGGLIIGITQAKKLLAILEPSLDF